MEKEENPTPESPQPVESPLKKLKSEAQQEHLPIQEEKKHIQASFKSLGIWEINTLPDGSVSAVRVSEPSSTSPLFGASSFDSSMCRSTSSGGSSGFGQKPTGVWTHLDAVSKRKYLEAALAEEKTRLDPGSGPFLLLSHPAITEEHGQTAKLESISAMPAYNYERYESCFAIAGANYCVVAADSTRGHTSISKLSEKSVMASCGFQADVKALQEALAAENSTYEREHKKPMSCPEMHRLFRNIHKLHPNYIFIVLGGLDSEGKGCVYQLFGPGVANIASGVGHPGSRQIERSRVPPILKYKLPAKDVLARMSETEAVRLAENVFRSANKTGDKLEIVVLNASGLHREILDLRKDRP